MTAQPTEAAMIINDLFDPVVNVLVGYEFTHRRELWLYDQSPEAFASAALDYAKRNKWLGADLDPASDKLIELATTLVNGRRFKGGDLTLVLG